MASVMYRIEIEHKGLNKYRVIKGADRYTVEQMAEAQLRQWDEMWERKQETERKRKERNRLQRDRERKKQEAIDLTQEAEESLAQVVKILEHTLKINDAVNWDSLKDKNTFPRLQPQKPEKKAIPPEPQRGAEKYQPKIGMLDSMFRSKKEKKIKGCEEKYKNDYMEWENIKRDIISQNQRAIDSYNQHLSVWKKEKIKFLKKQKKTNDAIELQKIKWEKKEKGAIIDYCEMVLMNSQYPDSFPKDFDVEYNDSNKVLVVEYILPNIDDLPRLKEVKYIQSRDEFSEKHMNDAQLKKLYDSVLYQIALRTIHEIYEADTIIAIGSIVFNGIVNGIDKATGQDFTACILSIQANRDEFEQINLCSVDPKACFKNLKGIGSAKLHGLTPVAPILVIDKEDRRFVEARDLLDTVDSADNLAAMDWLDFENLIRELFEKEFCKNGGEVKITQASRDGGVDAVAFDPDPIRGGKIVIQAKRYTNVVGVAAVRDLYGTVVNEGATKGILVTTSEYGPDAYGFAKGKPLTLLNGGNLLHMLANHGYSAKIDLKEAKKILSENI